MYAHSFICLCTYQFLVYACCVTYIVSGYYHPVIGLANTNLTIIIMFVMLRGPVVARLRGNLFDESIYDKSI